MDRNAEAKILADFVIERRAKKEGKTLGPNYWNSVLWRKKYQEQIVAAHSLLKVYPLQAILNGLKYKEVNWVYSLRNKQIIPYIQEEIRKTNVVKEQAKETKQVIKKQSPDKIGETFSTKKSKLSRLD